MEGHAGFHGGSCLVGRSGGVGVDGRAVAVNSAWVGLRRGRRVSACMWRSPDERKKNGLKIEAIMHRSEASPGAATSRRSTRRFNALEAGGRGRKPGGSRLRAWPATSASSPSDTSASRVDPERIEGCLVYSPGSSPHGVIHFVGGSFIGAVPDVCYDVIIQLLVAAGFLLIATPFNVSFDHNENATVVRTKFLQCWDNIDHSGLTSAGLLPGDIAVLPAFGFGHSMGALLLAIAGTQKDLLTSPGSLLGNVIISYTNKPASYFISGFDRLGPSVAQVLPSLESVLMSGPGMMLAAAEQMLETAEQVRGSLPPFLPEAITDPLSRFQNSFSPVFDEVFRGTSEYTPPPAENLANIREKYSVPWTLLVQFETDPIDETPALLQALQARVLEMDSCCRSVERVSVKGNHLTPIVQDIELPGNLLASVTEPLKNSALGELEEMSDVVVGWMRQHCETRFGSDETDWSA